LQAGKKHLFYEVITMKTMRAAVVEEPYRMKITQVPVPEINDDEVLIKVKYCGI
jgi:D-arabinose 1-dehydrogenase-like Zn-dependent alcohol dehydrogenase